MADEKVSVVVQFDAKTRQLDTAIAKLATLKKLDNRFSSGRSIEQYAQGTGRSLANVTKSWKRSFDFIDAGVKMTGKLLSGFLKFAIKGVIVEMALLGATMVGVHAVFVAGQYIMKAYRGAMQMLAQGAAAATVGIAAMSAAIREQQAAIYAYRGTGAKAFGSGMNQTRMAMRNLQMDASLATLGVENLNKAYGTMSKTMNVVQINQSGSAIKALMDFGSAGQDPAKGLEQVAVVIEALSNKKKGISDVITEAKKLGPEMEKALKTANVRTKKDFEKLLFSGDLAKKGGVSGQFEAVNSTLISQLKSYMTLLRGSFADFGDAFLEPLKVAFEKVFRVVQRDLARILGTVKFTIGTQGYFDGMVNAIDKVSNWMVTMIRQYLPAAQGMFGRMGDWFTGFRRGWNLILEQLRPLIDGARILYKAWDPIWEAIKRGADNLSVFRALLIDNQEDMEEFGERIGTFIDKFSEFMTNLKKMFADMAPFINDMVSGLTQVFQMLSKMMTGFAGGGLASALAPLMAFNVLGKTMSSVKGRLAPGVGTMSTQNMNVNAGNVTISGPAGPISGVASTLSSGAITSGASGVGAAAIADRLSSGATTSNASGAGATSIAEALASGKSGGGNFQKGAPKFMSYSEMRSDPSRSFFQNVGEGSRYPVRDSNLRERIAIRDEKRGQIGRGAINTILDRRANNLNIMGPSGGDVQSVGEGFRNTLRSGMLDVRGAGDRAQYAARRGFGAMRGGMAYLNSAGFDAEKGEYFDVDSQRQKVQDRFERENAERGKQTRGAQIRRMRAMNRINRNYSKFGNTYNTRFAKSATGRMGAGMGLGLASQFAPEEMRGSMALGATVAQMDPRLGLAVAGIGGAFTARGAGKGALSGAAGGAALGGMLGPQGALIGAGIGAVTGAIMGAINKGKYELKQARTAARESIAALYTDIRVEAGNQFEANRQKLEAGQTLTGEGAYSGYGKKTAAINVRARNDLSRAMEMSGGVLNEETGLYKLNANQAREALKIYAKSESGKGISDERLKDMSKKPGRMSKVFGGAMGGFKGIGKDKIPLESVNELADSASSEVGKRLVEIDEVNNSRIEMLSKMTGKSGAELEQLAKNMGFNLYDATVKYDELVTKFTKNLKMNKDQLNAALTDVFLAAAEPYRKAREAKEQQFAVNQIGKKMSDVLTGGGSEATKMGAVNEGMEQLLPAILSAAGGDATKAFKAYFQMFGTAGQGAFAKGQQFAGQEKYFLENELVQESGKQLKEGVASTAGTQIRGLLADKGMTVDAGLLEASIARMTDEQIDNLLTDINTLDKNTVLPKVGETNTLKKIGTGGAAGTQALLNAAGFTGINIEQITKTEAENLDKIATAADDFSKAAGGMKTAVETMNLQMAAFFKAPLGSMPEWWAKGLKWNDEEKRLMPDPGDTSSPRAGAVGDTATSRLSQTMSRHAAMNGQLTGKRTVTSSLRDYALGSPSSDHATGSAYDLTGQNLGMYARLVHANGGFAEFHGSMANRHLHVVPGQGIGDTSTSRTVSASPSSGGSVVNNYSFEINGANASPEAIANMVMMKIKNEERSQRERR